MKILGIDLAGKEKNETGICLLTEKGSSAKIVFSDNEILEEVEKTKPDLIAIDAPFSFPTQGYFRDSDILLKRSGFKPLSPLFPGMKPLVKRAIKLVNILSKKYRVIEVFPSATEKILELEKKKRANPHEYDALLCALTGKYYLEGKYNAIGKEKIIIPTS